MDCLGLDESQLAKMELERAFEALRPPTYSEGRTIDFKAKGGIIKVRIIKTLSSGRKLTVLLVHLIDAPRRLRRSLPEDGRMVLKLFDPMNANDDRRMTRDCTLRERTEREPDVAWGKEPRRALAEYARMRQEAEWFAHFKRVDLKWRGVRGVRLTREELWMGPGCYDKINFFKHLGKLEARHHISMQDYWREERVAYAKLRCHDGTLFPKMYAKVSMTVGPVDGGDKGAVPAYFYMPGCLVEYIDGPTVEEGLEDGLWEEKWDKLPRLLHNWAEELCLGDLANISLDQFCQPLADDIRVVNDAAYPDGLRFVHVKPAVVIFRDPRQSNKQFLGDSEETLPEDLARSCAYQVGVARGLIQDDGSADAEEVEYELFDPESKLESRISRDDMGISFNAMFCPLD